MGQSHRYWTKLFAISVSYHSFGSGKLLHGIRANQLALGFNISLECIGFHSGVIGTGNTHIGHFPYATH